MATDVVTPADWRTRWTVRVASWLIFALGRTWRVRVHGRDALLRRDASDPRVVLTLWHGQMLPILWAHRQTTGVMISEHRDGEIIARLVARFGFFAIRGSSSRGGARALLAAVRALREGADVAITPDGPRGPRHEFSPGALVVALRAAVNIVPIVAHSDRVWRFASWDAFELPKPFARVTVLYGEPRAVIGAKVHEASELAPRFATAMSDELARVGALAHAHVGVNL